MPFRQGFILMLYAQNNKVSGTIGKIIGGFLFWAVGEEKRTFGSIF